MIREVTFMKYSKIRLDPIVDLEARFSSLSPEAYEQRARGTLSKADAEAFEEIMAEYVGVDHDSLGRARKFYDFLSAKGMNVFARYDNIEFSKAIVPKVMEEIYGSKCVADIGCFDGLHAVTYAMNMPGAEVIGMDISGESIKSAKDLAARYGLKNIRFVAGDVLSMPFVNRFDAITATSVLNETYEVIPWWSAFNSATQTDHLLEDKLAEIRKIAGPGAKVVMSFLPQGTDLWARYLADSISKSGFHEIRKETFGFKAHDANMECLFVVARAD